MSRMNTLLRPSGLVAMLRRVQSARGRQLTGYYSIEGTRLVERALRAGVPLVAVLAAETLATRHRPGDEARHGDLLAAVEATACPITFVPDNVVGELTEGRDLGQILGLVRLPEQRSLAALLAEPPDSAGPHPAPWLLAAVDIVDPGNVGALTRTAHAAGAAALLVSGASDPFHPRATRISRGSVFKLPVIAYREAEVLLADLFANGIAAVATAASGGVPLPEFAWPPGGTAVLMGNEAEGLPAALASTVDHHVTIPMTAGVDSYSVNAAAAILMYELRYAAGNRG